eukprot:c9600_g1_i2.p1 GENE.c9600_g1_i2~~c9600_g1_i2.p1  ORF type:complete len:527 (+),score=162.25 c9600_g1_i2:43-1623(+)
MVDITGDGGLLKEILVAGAGDESPQPGDDVYVHYVGTLASDGSQFDSSRDRDAPFNFTLGKGNVIKGWDVGVATMKRGEKAIFTIRADYGYGDRGSPPKIPGGATLKFEVELLRWNEKEVAGTDGAVTLRVLNAGTGWQNPEEGDEVVVQYVGRSNGKEFVRVDQPTPVVMGTGVLPAGVEKALTSEGKKGTKLHVSLNSEWASGFGADGHGAEFEIELFDWNTVSDIHGDHGIVVKTIGQVSSYESCDDACKVTLTLQGTGFPGNVVFEAEHQVVTTIGDGDLPYALEQGLGKLKKGQSATVSITNAYLKQGDFESVLYTVKIDDVVPTYSLNFEDKIAASTKRREQGNNYFNAGDYTSALSKYKNAFKLVEHASEKDDDKKAAIDQMKLLCHLNKAMVYKKQNDLKTALSECRDALKISPSHAKALFRLGTIHLALGELADAKSTFERVKELDPTITDADKQLALVAKEQKKRDQTDKRLFAKMLGGLTGDEGNKEPEKPVQEGEMKDAEGDSTKQPDKTQPKN